MRAVSVTKTLHYKRAAYLQGTGNLQDHLKTALSRTKTVGVRKQVVNPEDDTCLLLNSVRNRWGMTFGSMILFTRGRNQPLVTDDDAAAELTVEQLAPPPNRSGARREFIESLLFFGILQNHVVLLQSQGLRARQLESHLGWLLQTKTNTVSDEDQIALIDQPTPDAVKKVLEAPVKKVTVGVPLQSRPDRRANAEEVAERFSFRPTGAGFQVLKSLLGTEWLKNRKLADSLDESRLKVDIMVSYYRSTDKCGQELLNEIAVNLRHQEPEDVKIQLHNGVQLSGPQLKVSGPVQVTVYGGLADPEDLFPTMRDWLREQLRQGIVDS